MKNRGRVDIWPTHIMSYAEAIHRKLENLDTFAKRPSKQKQELSG